MPHAIEQSVAVYSVLIGMLILSARRRPKNENPFSVSVTTELKGLAIIAVIFSHIWIFLVSDRHFLVPLAGVSQAGVDLFLLLSGYGLSVSNLRRPQSVLAFYKRLLKLFIPLWISLTVFLIIDAIFLSLHYPVHTVILDYLGIYLTSDLGRDLDAPLWFITYITACYLLFPWIFRKQQLWLSALILFVIGVTVATLNPPLLQHVTFLYAWHPAAFPTGMLLAWYLQKQPELLERVRDINPSIRAIAVSLLLAALILINPQSHGASAAPIVQVVDLAFAFTLLALFVIKPIEFRLLNLLGTYSFEMYLLHWPIISRYDFLYGRTPAWLATLLYLLLTLILGYLLQKLTAFFNRHNVYAALRFIR